MMLTTPAIAPGHTWLPEWHAAEAADGHFAGIHYYMDRLGCLKRAYGAVGDADGSEDADFGTAVHAALYAYHTGAAKLPPLSDERPERSCSEAEVMSRYAARFPKGWLGTVLSGETRYRSTVAIGGITHPIAGTIDLVTEMDVAAVCAFTRTVGSDITLEPGIWLHDYKTKKNKSALTVPQLMYGEQAPLYERLFKDTHPEMAERVRGTIFHLLYRYIGDKPGNEQFLSIAVPSGYAGDGMERVVSIIADAAERVARLGMDHVTPTDCYDWMRVCPLFDVCERKNEVKQ